MSTHQTFFRSINLLTVHITVLKQQFCLSVHNALVRSIDDGKVSVLLLFDLSAAFDTVDHDILLSLLSRWFCIRDTAHDWFRA